MTVWYDVAVFNKGFVEASWERSYAMTLMEAYLIGGAVVLGLMALLWLISLALRDSSIVDTLLSFPGSLGSRAESERG